MTLQRFNRWSLKLDNEFHPTLCWPGDYLSMLRLKLNHVSKRDPRPLLDNSLTSAAGCHYNEVIMGSMAFQITSLTIVFSTGYSGADQRKHQSSASLAFCWPVNSPHKRPVTRNMFPFDDVITWKYLINDTKQIYIISKQYKFQYIACLKQIVYAKSHEKAITILSAVHHWSGHNRKPVGTDDLI